jgi:hypothetical protein
MRASWSFAVVIVLLICRPAYSDTITTKENLSINGSISGMSDGVLRIEAWFSSTRKDVWIPIKDLLSIEFNSLTINAGAPPKILGFGPPRDQNTPQKETPGGGVIVLRGGSRQSCILVGIDADRVQCNPKNIDYDRNAVLRIVFGYK